MRGDTVTWYFGAPTSFLEYEESSISVALALQAPNGTVGNTGDVAEWSKAPHC